jgi:phosphate transport system substrate-binding protein
MMNKMKCTLAGTLTVAVVLAGSLAAAEGPMLNGAGASFPAPIYTKWAVKYSATTGTKINYQSIGSGGGIAQIKARTVDFGASDEPLKKEELDQAGLLQFPTVMGAVAIVVNIPGIGNNSLKMSGEVLGDIFLGKIAKWDDPAITALNPEARLPSSSIVVVHRADGSGTTWTFTDYLSKASAAWRDKVGTGKSVKWPTGIGAKGNEGVAGYVQNVTASIGYVEFAYALENKIACAQLKNKAGQFVAPALEAVQAAARAADWKNAPGFYMVLNDEPGEATWPIVGVTFILMHRDQADAAKGEAVLKFFDWCYTQGGAMARELQYVPVPPAVVEMIQASWRSDLKASGQAIWK